MTMEEMKETEKMWHHNGDLCDVSKSLDDALLAYYLNSGYGRFNEHLSFSQAQDGCAINTDEIVEELSNEELSPEELNGCIESYFGAHDFGARLCSCGACGIRQFESSYDSASIEYHRVRLLDLPSCHFEYDNEETSHLEEIIDKGPIKVAVASSADTMSDPTVITLKPWQMISYYRSEQNNILYHIHPELVEIDNVEGKITEFTWLCPRCHASFQKNECHPLSIAAGIDFGNYQRVDGLEKPNLHEQLILSKYRLYSATIKVVPNGRGFQRNHGMNAMRGNQILFAHDAPYKVAHANVEDFELEDMFEVQFYGDKEYVDHMAKRAYRTSKLFARIRVLRQWFAVLQKTNPHYSDLDDQIVNHLMGQVERIVAHKTQEPVYITDQASLNHEKGLGSDVAAVQQVDAMASEYKQVDDNDHQQVTTSYSEDELPVKTHYVSQSPDALLGNNSAREHVEFQGFKKLVSHMREEKPTGDDRDTSEDYDSIMSSDDETFEEEEALFVKLRGDKVPSGKSKGLIKSHRSVDPANELAPTDELLTCTFPCVFPLGQGYKRKAGNLSNQQLHHLLHQFHLVPSRDSRLLGYLADVKRRFDVVKNSHLKLSGHERSIEKVNDFFNNDNHKAILEKLKTNPDDPDAKKLWKKFKSELELVGGNIMYGALESSRCMTQTFETAKRYGQGCVFLTMSFDDIFNSRGIRAAFKTVDNQKFPASFGENSAYGSLKDFLDAIKEQAVDHGNGTIPFDEGEGLNFQKSELSRLAMENPVAYVSETKAVLNHVLTILLGCPPEGCFGAHEGKSTRKTRYFKNRQHSKGIFGHILAYAGVVEDHVKGTLHFHIILFGSVTPFVLHKLASVTTICKKVAEVLDQFYKAKFSTLTNFRNVLTREIRKSTGLRGVVDPELLSPPALLQRWNPIEQLQMCHVCGVEDLGMLTCNERASHCFHEHHKTCRKGFHGKTRCRLCKKSGLCDGTCCVQLQRVLGGTTTHTNPTTALEDRVPEEIDELNPEEDSYVSSSSEEDDDISLTSSENDNSTTSDEQECSNANNTAGIVKTPIQDDLDDKYKYIVKNVPIDEEPKYHVRSPIDRTDRDIIVWEPDRPIPTLEGIQGFDENCTLLDVLELDRECTDEQTLRGQIVSNFQILLQYEKGTVGHPYGNKNCKLWIFLESGDIDKVIRLYRNVIEALRTSNQYAVDHNIPLFYCTGSHNNAVLLGASEQAKAAMFYIAPYMAKEKAPLLACLTILEKARKEVQQFPSRAADRATKPEERRAKHFITKVANKLNAYTELSDYQVAAFLLHVPSVITSEVFHYSEPNGAMNYRSKYLEEYGDLMEEDKQAMENKYLGYSRTYLIEKNEEGDKSKDVHKAIPVVSNYFYRGEELQHLSLFEYDAIIQTKVKPENPSSSKGRSKWFLFHENSDLSARWGQTLHAKQRTLIFKGKPPKYPGKQPPTNNATYDNWLKRANSYANYILTMFRPCPIFNGPQQQVRMEPRDYGWTSLVTWINALQQEDTVLSKFRLMAIDRRMNSLTTDFGTKKTLSHYRARASDIWTKHQRRQLQLEKRYMALFERQHNELLLDDDIFEEQHNMLSGRATKVAKQVNSDAEAFAYSITESVSSEIAANNISRWVVPCAKSKTVLDTKEGARIWYDKCDWLYQDGDDDDGSPYCQRPNEDDDDDKSSTSKESVKTATCINEEHNRSKKTELNSEQKQVVDLYRLYLQQDDNVPLPSSVKSPPPVVLLTGRGGTGKSFVINTLLQLGNDGDDGLAQVWTCANNNLNAADIDGTTIASLLKQTIEPSKDGQATNQNTCPQKRIPEAAVIALQRRKITNLKLLIIDEISNVTANKLGELSRLFQMATGNSNKLFGGIPVLLVGDYNQKEPVGELATTSLLKYIDNKYKLEVMQRNPIKVTDDGDITANAKTRRQATRRACKEDSVFTKTKYNDTSDHATGCRIIANARWFELTQSERSKDKTHNAFIDELYIGKNMIKLDKIKEYDIYNFQTASQDDPIEHAKWIRAPVIVKTNRERITINYRRAIDFARQTNTYFIRWPAKYSQWEDKPPYSEMEEILEDPAFWEIFVAEAPCYLNNTICKKKRLCNGTRGQFHSLLLDDKIQAEFESQAQAGCTIITLSAPPQGINILIEDENVTSKRDWYGLETRTEGATASKNQIIVPIQPSAFSDRDKPTYIISPNILIRPSRVKISLHFPVRGGFAITVDKAQGQTLDRVIIALSARDHALSNFTFACVYVALSRVRERKHVRILLKKSYNEKTQWETLLYLSNLRKRRSVDAYFAGFHIDRTKWVNDEWDMKKAFSRFYNK